MLIILKMILGCYAILMLIAAFQNFRTTHRYTNIIICLSSLTILIALFLSSAVFTPAVIVSLILFQLTAFLTGRQQQFHLTHHLIRLIITSLLIIAVLTSS